jgi:vancomycin resistance protein YoaR
VLEHWNFRYYLGEVNWFVPGLDSFIDSQKDLRVKNIWKQPLLFRMDEDEGELVLRVFTCFQESTEFSIKEAMRRVTPARMQTMIDQELQSGEQRIERSRIAGLQVAIQRMVQKPNMEPKVTVVWKSKYQKRDGIVHLPADEMNIYEGYWNDFGQDELTD